MKYNKPEVTRLAPAIDAIQNSTAKMQQTSFDGVRVSTLPAYEADE